MVQVRVSFTPVSGLVRGDLFEGGELCAHTGPGKPYTTNLMINCQSPIVGQ